MGNEMMWLGTLMIGLAGAALGLFCQDYAAAAFRYVEEDLADKLTRLRYPTRRLRTYLTLWLAAMIASFFGFWLVLESWIFAIVITVLLIGVPWYVIRRLAEYRRQKIEDQLADAMVTLANAIRAGLSLPQALEMLAAQSPKPISTEFHQIIGEYKLGKPLERTLLEAKERLKSENFALFAAAMLASHESGGRLNETVERIAQSVLELQRLERKVLSETAQARKSAVYMAIVPVFVLVVYYFVDPENTRLLFVTAFGQFILATAMLLNILAYFWARKILSPDI
ncbi:MAG TPA: type II secretion system F family protein [Thermoguttaceae bacterium]|nr:type II secretion system F family protein [Thermoguttaceae bacterium]